MKKTIFMILGILAVMSLSSQAVITPVGAEQQFAIDITPGRPIKTIEYTPLYFDDAFVYQAEYVNVKDHRFISVDEEGAGSFPFSEDAAMISQFFFDISNMMLYVDLDPQKIGFEFGYYFNPDKTRHMVLNSNGSTKKPQKYQLIIWDDNGNRKEYNDVQIVGPDGFSLLNQAPVGVNPLK